LPLDDPNMDFTLPIKLTKTEIGSRHTVNPMPWGGAAPRQLQFPLDVCFISTLCTSRGSGLAASGSLPPLRC
jgi:hypothetical protein